MPTHGPQDPIDPVGDTLFAAKVSATDAAAVAVDGYGGGGGGVKWVGPGSLGPRVPGLRDGRVVDGEV